jgi:prepilin-type N-terminal cleavage/methylation domain-containing protein
MLARDAHHRAFSLIELVIVVIIMGVIAAIALPRFGSAVDHATSSSLTANVEELQRAIDLYTSEHQGLAPGKEVDSSVVVNPQIFYGRLLKPTDLDGSQDDDGIYGPYLRFWPINPVNGVNKLRIDGAPAPANLAGWRYDSASNAIQSDAIAASGKPSGTVATDLQPITSGSVSFGNSGGATLGPGGSVGADDGN